MKLFASNTSPFVRKVRVVLREKGAEGLVTEEIVVAREDPPALHAANPLGKIPALILDDGMALFDSPVICEYLDTTLPGPSLLPASGPKRWKVLRLEAAADGILDAGVATIYEGMRPTDERSPAAMLRWRNAIIRSLDFLESELGATFASPDIGLIAVGCALGYLDFRFPDIAWRDTRPALAAHFEALSARRSFKETMPRA
ncbi:MAG: glutathione S-transferase N-terminal domain-containing protein [Parvibaculum sedimenti]|uniref:glutathione S-transferase N-terminal domain-containing protein n=1 Tax=Parvibaculum sedimenti TaxID=2608632 RepID=UPI003BB53CD3